ncbi:MAG: hypothetical protein Q4D29_03310 [Lachnospiraceae bacterium]|nr:hypothetical protein [Lachnospiraceae bacterium]
MLTGCKNQEITANYTNDNTEKASENVENNSGKDIISDGEYEVGASLVGGTGKATIKSPAKAVVTDGKIIATIEWSSSNYDYMIVDGEKIYPVNESGNSVFEIPVEKFDCDINVIADTVAMSKPHEIEYTIKLSSESDYKADVLDFENDFLDKDKKPVQEDIVEWKEKHTVTGKLERKYAEQFAVSYYDNKYTILTVSGTDHYCLSKNDNDVPSDLPNSITVIKIPIDNVCVVGSASYNYFSTLDSMSCIKFTSLKKNDTDDAFLEKKIDDGTIKYAGKYSAPDY